MADIFLSYAHEDAKHARTLAEALARESFSVWWDRHILPGKSWPAGIERELDNAGCVVVLWSQSSVHSQFVQNEAREGLNRQVLVPVIANQAVRPPLEFRHLQAAYLHGWNTDDNRSEYAQLVTSVRDVLRRVTANPSTSELAPSRLSSRTVEWLWIGVLALLVAIGALLWQRAGFVSPPSGDEIVEDLNREPRNARRGVAELNRRSTEAAPATSTAPRLRPSDDMRHTSSPALSKWHVHIQIPTSMTSAEVHVDGQSASVVKRVASLITIEIPVGKESHEFRVSSLGKRPCVVTRSIQQSDVVIQPCQM